MKTRFAIFVLISVFICFFVWMVDRESYVLISYQGRLWNVSAFKLMFGIIVFLTAILMISESVILFWKKQMEKEMRALGENCALMKKNEVDGALSCVLKTMTSITEGDMKSARKFLKELENKIGKGTITQLLELKIFKGEKKFDAVQKLSAELSEKNSSELIGLKALVETSSKNKKFDEALKSANRAFEIRQDLYWVIENTFRLRAMASDYEGAIEVLDAGRQKKMIDREKYEVMKAVSLYEMGLKYEKNQPILFEKCMREAYGLYPSFVPVALKFADFEKKNGQLRNAEKILKEIWRLNPTYDVAEAYLKLFKNVSGKELAQKMERFAALNSQNVALNHIVLAEIYMKAKLYDCAKAEFEMFLIHHPATKKLARLIAQYEKNVKHNDEAAQNWLKEEKDFAEDNVYRCRFCGHTERHFMPFCKKCVEFNPFEWLLYLKKTKGE